MQTSGVALPAIDDLELLFKERHPSDTINSKELADLLTSLNVPFSFFELKGWFSALECDMYGAVRIQALVTLLAQRKQGRDLVRMTSTPVSPEVWSRLRECVKFKRDIQTTAAPPGDVSLTDQVLVRDELDHKPPQGQS